MSMVENSPGVLRMIDINNDEQAIIRVRTDHHISLVFSRCTIDLFEKDGVVYTRHDYDAPDSSYTEETWESKNDDDNLETQPFDYQPSKSSVTTPLRVVVAANGHFDEVNARHESTIQDLGADLNYSYGDAGGTQIEDYDETQMDLDPVDWDFLYAVVCPDSQCDETLIE